MRAILPVPVVIALCLISFSVTAQSRMVSSDSLFTTKYDFQPGEKILVYEDFSRVEVGDFPNGWNTEAVSTALVSHFALKAERLETDGKGETEPAGNGNTPEAKAANRRVVFTKL